ncbi:hypothetical protein NSA48_04345 [Frisingicoccus caecimuris]|uniref:hypothetical protein n=1 Tax=Frisingicoccus caecimuris TaxID=1796636 RepID=UPI001045533A|nr:hypothetical protein [Frisingicoccus caecimuris]MCR1918273.1 hypothetical protein [Frisingicoccus caecimuris]
MRKPGAWSSISLQNYAKALVRRGVPEDLEPGERIFEKVKNFREKPAASGEGLGRESTIKRKISKTI